MILDISCIAGQIRKNAASPIRTCCVKKHIHLLLICFAVYRRDCCFFSGTNISQILCLSSATTCQFVYTILPHKTRTGSVAASDTCTSAGIPWTQSPLPAINSKTFTDWGSLLLLSRIRTVPPPPDGVKRWAHFHRDGSLGA